jgi:hypothetical protein
LSVVNPGPIKTYKYVKSVEQYNDIISILTHWGDDNFLTAAPENDSVIFGTLMYVKYSRVPSQLTCCVPRSTSRYSTLGIPYRHNDNNNNTGQSDKHKTAHY